MGIHIQNKIPFTIYKTKIHQIHIPRLGSECTSKTRFGKPNSKTKPELNTQKKPESYKNYRKPRTDLNARINALLI